MDRMRLSLPVKDHELLDMISMSLGLSHWFVRQTNTTGLTALQLQILLLLQESMRVQDLIAQLKTDKSTVSQHLSKLFKRDLISYEENSSDRRYKLIRLNEAGQVIVQDFQAELYDRLDPILKQWQTAEKNALGVGLQLLSRLLITSPERPLEASFIQPSNEDLLSGLE